ncbi:GntR family transcriptional regulator [Ahrensia sp. R2A130]|uniref:GntR family transcriptional regulator n=1 Tax=Ahrensia sp. R2A130 TaxID=744979 RepID=UPI0001E0E112|nr:GntR family transcriptional regulator [Ahrensia sp. R2A130]EFL87553.1 GntR family transcriptional regulator [Ahrensia sp. R2A130]
MASGTVKLAAAEQAYRTIRADIVSGVLVEGERLTEERLSHVLGVSRTPVRDAIRRLTHEGFIERHSGYTTRVARFPEDEMKQAFDLRQMLECYACERAAQLATDEEVDLITGYSEEIASLTPPRNEDEHARMTEANEAFHRTIAKAARSPRLIALMSLAFDVGMVVRTYRRYSEEELIRSAGHHREIADAIRARSPEWAGSAMRTHIRAAQTAAGKAAARTSQGIAEDLSDTRTPNGNIAVDAAE